MKRSGFPKLTHEQAVKKSREWQDRQRVRAREKTRETGVKRPKSGLKRQSAKTIANKPLEEAFKLECRQRDGYRCRWIDSNDKRCLNYDERIPVHHINEKSQRPDQRFDPDNGACICWVHHNYMHHTVAGRHRGRELGLLGGETYEKAGKAAAT